MDPILIGFLVVLFLASPVIIFLVASRGIRKRHKLVHARIEEELEAASQAVREDPTQGERIVRGQALAAPGSGPAPRADPKRLPTAGTIVLGGEPIDPADEPKHFLFAGATGSGKTQGINQVLGAARARRAPAIVADAGGRALEGLFEKDDLIFNPFDARSVGWSPFAEVRTDYDCLRIAKAAIPEGEGESREWHLYAQTLLGETMLAMHRLRNHSMESLLHYLNGAGPAALKQLLAGTAAGSLTESGNEKMLANTRAILATYLVAWRHLPDAGQFSIREWVTAEKPGCWLFITYREDQFAMMRHLIAMLLDLAVIEALSLEEREERQLWFVMDEVDSLSKIASLRHALTKLRKYGGRCVLGLQTISQLRSTYGEHEAQTLMANVGIKLVLRAGDGETAEYFSREFGHQEVERAQGSTARRRLGTDQTDTVSDVRETRRIVLDSDISGLVDLEGFLKRPGSLTRIRLEYRKGDRRAESFVPAADRTPAP